MTEHDEPPAPTEYEVGFGRPPKQHQFAKGRSGNPKGRPKRNLDLVQNTNTFLNEIVTSAKGQKMTRMEAFVRRIVAGALRGNQSDFREFLKLADRAGMIRPLPPPPAESPILIVPGKGPHPEVQAMMAQLRQERGKGNSGT